MSKAFIAAVIQQSASLTGMQANVTAQDLLDAITKEIRRNKRFTIPSFGSFRVARVKARNGFNPKTGERIRIKAKKTVRFKVSPILRQKV